MEDFTEQSTKVSLCNWAGQAGGIKYVHCMQMDKMDQSNIHKVQKQGHESQPKDDTLTVTR